MPTFETLRADYAVRWAAMEIRPSWAARARQAAEKILSDRGRYEPVSAATGVPWAVVGIIHTMEAAGSFKKHLHNGDPLSARTRQMPAGRPLKGKPPFSWEASALDALVYDGLDKITDWGPERLCWCLEKFNGFGYREKGVPSAYLWSGTDQYAKGKYIRDGVWSARTVSDQVGGMAIFAALVELEPSVSFDEAKPGKSTVVGAALDAVKTALTPAPKAPAKPTLLAWMQAQIGVAEFPGDEENNPIIAEWHKTVGHPEITADEPSWCAVALGAGLVAAGLPTTPVNVNRTARSYESYGVAVALDDIQPGDIAIWPRGNVAWQGHINVVEQITGDGSVRKVICIGGNQSTDTGADAVTRSKPRPVSQAVCFRRPVQSTVPALREAGSTDIQDGDNVQKVGGVGAFLLSAFAALKELWAPVATAPEVTGLPDALTFWQQVLGSLNAVGRLLLANPWLGGIAFVGLMLVWVGHKMKTKRVAKAAAGMPLFSQVVAGAVAETEAE